MSLLGQLSKAVTPPRYSDEASLPTLPKDASRELSIPPNLEAFIPGECLPDDIDVYNNFTFPPALPNRGFIPPYPIRFVRKYPSPLPTPVDKGTFNIIVMGSVRLTDADTAGDQVMGQNSRSPRPAL